MPKFKFNKLVRDKIIDNQIALGAQPCYHVLDTEACKQELVRKIAEEAQEILHAKPDELAGELADVQQALDDLRALYGVSGADMTVAQRAKNDKNGSFKKGIYIEYLEMGEDDPWLDYYRKNADRYPEFD